VVLNVSSIRSRLGSGPLAAPAERFLKWINYCYYFNQSKVLSADTGLAALDDIDCLFAHHLGQVTVIDRERRASVGGFLVPAPEALVTVAPERLFDVRTSPEAAEYFDAIDNCQEDPREENRQVLLDKLGRYVSKMNRAYLEHGRSLINWGHYLRAIVPSGCSPLLVEIAKILITHEIGRFVPCLGSISLVGKFAAITYTWMPEELGSVLGIERRLDIDLDAQSALFRSRKSSSLSMLPQRGDTDASFK